MRLIIKYLLMLFFLCSFSSGATPFPDLVKKELKFSWPEAEVKNENQKYYFSYNKKYFTEINKILSSLPKTDPLYTNDAAANDILVGVVDLSGNGEMYYVVLSFGPSYDICYYFYSVKKVKEYVQKPDSYLEDDFKIASTSLIVPSNGNIYSYGHNDNLYNLKSKYVFKQGKISELPQQFFYIGEKTSSLKDQIIFSDPTLTSELFKISKGAPVTIVGVQPAQGSSYDLYIVASEFGLVGFAKADGGQEATQFAGFYYNGD